LTVIWTIAWRNVWRNGRRSTILITAIAFGIWAGIMEMALMNGMAEQQVEAAIRTRTSHIQLHAPGFLAHRDVSLAIPGGDSVLARVRRLPGVEAATGRAVLNAMATSATTSRGVTVFGVDAEAERRTTDVAARIVAGHDLDGAGRNAALIGERLAQKLGLRLGQKLVVMGQAGDGSIGAGAFRIAGLFRTVSSSFDESTVFVRRADLARSFALGGLLHEIAVRVQGAGAIEPVAGALRRAWPGLDVATWRDLSPEIALTQDSTEQMNDIFLIVILIALVFGITNTMLMGVLERTRELGVVIALGMRPAPVFAMVLAETVVLSAAGGVAGVGLGALSVAVLARTGIDLSFVASGLAAFGFDRVIHPVLPAARYPSVVLLVIATAVVASLYPGWKAVRLDPVRAIHAQP
jgi:putative ABC transport system permease protein